MLATIVRVGLFTLPPSSTPTDGTLFHIRYTTVRVLELQSVQADVIVWSGRKTATGNCSESSRIVLSSTPIDKFLITVRSDGGLASFNRMLSGVGTRPTVRWTLGRPRSRCIWNLDHTPEAGTRPTFRWIPGKRREPTFPKPPLDGGMDGFLPLRADELTKEIHHLSRWW